MRKDKIRFTQLYEAALNLGMKPSNAARFTQLYEAALNLGMKPSNAAYYAEAVLLAEILQGNHD